MPSRLWDRFSPQALVTQQEMLISSWHRHQIYFNGGVTRPCARARQAKRVLTQGRRGIQGRTGAYRGVQGRTGASRDK